MIISDIMQANEHTRSVWNTNAAFWNERMGDEGNDFVNTLIWPPTQRLLAEIAPDAHVLDVACGNGLYARKLATMGTRVTAFDFAPAMVELARSRTAEYGDQVDCRVVDATDSKALLDLGEGFFDAAICQMALFDMVDIRPLLAALTKMMKPGAPFIFSLMHPCFNNPFTTFLAERVDRDGDVLTEYSLKVFGYKTSGAAWGAAIAGQSKPHIYFHRPLEEIFSELVTAGLTVDAIQEPAFQPDHPEGSSSFSWGPNFSEIPPVLLMRARTSG